MRKVCCLTEHQALANTNKKVPHLWDQPDTYPGDEKKTNLELTKKKLNDEKLLEEYQSTELKALEESIRTNIIKWNSSKAVLISSARFRSAIVLL